MAQGNYGTSTNPLQQIHGEQVVYEPLTSDPPASEREEGSKWFRSDMDSGSKIGTLRLQNDDAGNDIDDIPVFAEGDSVNGVVKARPLQTPNGEGFVPYQQEGGTFDQLRFQHNGTWYGANDSLNGIPDSEDLHARYDATQLSLSDGGSVSTWSDETGNGHDLTQATAANQPTYQTGQLNGNPVVRFDGSSDFLDVIFTTLAQPNHVFMVFQIVSGAGTGASIYDAEGGSTDRNFQGITGNGDWTIFAGSTIAGTAADTTAHVSAALFNGASSALRVDGSVDASGDAGAQGLDGLTVGSRFDQTQFANVDIGEFLVYPQDKSGVQSDVEQYLSDKWGITI